MRTNVLALLVAVTASACANDVTQASGGSGGSGGTGGSGGSGGGGSGGGPACVAPTPLPSFGVGTGETCYEPALDGVELPLINGPQGGYHVWLAIGCSGACSGATQLRYGIQHSDTGAWVVGGIMGSLMAASALHEDAGWSSLAGIQASMPGLSWDPMSDPPLPKGSMLRLHAEALDDAGTVLDQASVDFVLGDTQYWDPCSGDPNDPNCQLG